MAASLPLSPFSLSLSLSLSLSFSLFKKDDEALNLQSQLQYQAMDPEITLDNWYLTKWIEARDDLESNKSTLHKVTQSET
jgi:hypothetical protein